MSASNLYGLAAVLICALVTILIRSLPFLAFGSRKLPPVVEYLGRVLPGAIMIILVIYCLKGVSFTTAPFGAPELISILLCAVLQYKLNNSIPSIFAATALYMVLIRTVF